MVNEIIRTVPIENTSDLSSTDSFGCDIKLKHQLNSVLRMNPEPISTGK